MRGPILSVVLFVGVTLLAEPSAGTAHASMQTSSLPGQVRQPMSPGSDPNSIDKRGGEPNDPMAAMREAARQRSATNERQKKSVDDTAKLLALATELKQEVDKTTKDQMSLEVIRKADEIERLAHDVKQRMKG